MFLSHRCSSLSEISKNISAGEDLKRGGGGAKDHQLGAQVLAPSQVHALSLATYAPVPFFSTGLGCHPPVKRHCLPLAQTPQGRCPVPAGRGTRLGHLCPLPVLLTSVSPSVKWAGLIPHLAYLKEPLRSSRRQFCAHTLQIIQVDSFCSLGWLQ